MVVVAARRTFSIVERCWNNNKNKATTLESSNNNNNNNWKLLVTESRLRVSRMLASIGSPLLKLLLLLEEPHSIRDNSVVLPWNNSSSSSSTTTTSVHSMIRTVEEFVQTMVDWIQTVDRVMLILRCSSSVRLGLGGITIDSPCVARVERASLARMVRHFRSKQTCSSVMMGATTTAAATTAATVSLAVIRQRLHQVMRIQNNLLRSIIHPAVMESMEEPSVGSRNDDNDEEEEVLTLSLLQSMRRESAELVSSAADTLYSAGVTEAQQQQQQQQQIQKLLQTTREACEYFESFLECRQRQQRRHNVGSHAAIGSDIQAIHQQLVDLQSLVTSCHGVLCSCCENESSSALVEEQQFQQLWSEFGKRFSLLHGMVENVDSRLVNQNASNGEIGNNVMNGQNEDLDKNALASSSATEVGEYTSGDLSGSKRSKTESRSVDGLHDNTKVLVYTGKGAGSTNRVRRAVEKSDPTRTLLAEPPERNPQTESLLMEELTKHLSDLPPLVEKVVARTTDTVPSGEEAGEDNACESKPNEPSETRQGALCPSGETAVAFLTELSDAIHASQLGNDAL